MPEVIPVGNILEDITKRQEEQIKNQNEVIKNQNNQISKLQNILSIKEKELEETKNLNKKARTWNWVLGITAIISGIAGVVSMILTIIK